MLYFSAFVEDACYGGYVDINCAPRGIYVSEEIYGRHPEEKCAPSARGDDCSVEGDFYKKLCHNKTRCQHLGVGWRNIKTANCPDIYTNYVHIVYQCVSEAPRKYTLTHHCLGVVN